MTNVRKFIVEYFLNKTGINSDKLKLKDNYLSQGYLDSLGIFELVTVIEKKFDIKFVNSDLIDDEFVTIEGVCNIVEKKCNTIKELNHSKVENSAMKG